MKVLFSGTGAAEGVPAEFCSCAYCKRIRELGKSEFRTRSQVIIDGNLSVDFPPDAFSRSLENGIFLSDLKYLFVTHSHMDHFYAHDFILRGYRYAEFDGSPLEIYGDAEVKAVFGECTAREMKPVIAEKIRFTVLEPYTEIKAGEYRVLTLPANHKTKEKSLLYYIEKNGKGYLHFYDSHILEDKPFEFLAERGAKANLVAFDCTFAQNTSSPAARHMGIHDNMAMKRKLLEYGITDESAKIVITHFSHNANPVRARLKALEEQYGVIAAYDGMVIEL